ncbi:MAG: hypothetical protein JO025_05800 [Verrucomicrobia bacterium]|nr:hypothetical protein [Verrucomicrobiota bacterium]
MTPKLNSSSAGSAFAIDALPAIVALQDENQKDVNRAKTFLRLARLVKPTTGLFEGLAGVLAVFYLLAVVALSGALLFFTFSR